MPELKATTCEIKMGLSIPDDGTTFFRNLLMELNKSETIKDRFFGLDSHKKVCIGSNVILYDRYYENDHSILGVFGIIDNNSSSKFDQEKLKEKNIDLNETHIDEEIFNPLIIFTIHNNHLVHSTASEKNLNLLASNLSQLTGDTILSIDKRIECIDNVNLCEIKKIEIFCNPEDKFLDKNGGTKIFKKIFKKIKSFIDSGDIQSKNELEEYFKSSIILEVDNKKENKEKQLQGVLRLVDSKNIIITTKHGRKIEKKGIDISNKITWKKTEDRYYDYDLIHSEMMKLIYEAWPEDENK